MTRSARRSLGLAALLASAAFAFPGSAAAIAPRGGETVVVDAPLADDLYAGGGDIAVTAAVDGDVVAAAGLVSIEAPVTGGILAVGRTVRVRARIGRTVRAAAFTIDLDGPIAADAAVAGFHVRVGPRARVARDLAASGNEVEVAGAVGRRAYLSGETVRLSGRFGGDVSVEASNVIVFPTARIAGRLFYRSDAVADIRDGARIDGGVQRTARAEAPARVGGPRFRPFGGYHAFETFWLLVLGLLAVAVAREGTRDVVHRVACRFGASLLVGALVLMLAPAVGLLLFVTIVGIPLALAGFVVYAFSLYLGQIFAAGWLGAAIVRRAAPETPPAPFGEMAVGVLLLSILFLVPGVGWLVRAIAAVAGFGALWWVLYRRAVPPRESGAGVPPVAG